MPISAPPQSSAPLLPNPAALSTTRPARGYLLLPPAGGPHFSDGPPIPTTFRAPATTAERFGAIPRGDLRVSPPGPSLVWGALQRKRLRSYGERPWRPPPSTTLCTTRPLLLGLHRTSQGLKNAELVGGLWFRGHLGNFTSWLGVTSLPLPSVPPPPFRG